MVLRELYETIFEISDLDNDDEPLAIIAMSDKEGLWELGPRARLIREFHLYRVREHFCDWNSFLALPKHETDFMINMLRDIEIKSEAAAKRAQAELNKGNIPTGM